MGAGLLSHRQAVASQGLSIGALDSEIAADRAREPALSPTCKETDKGNA